MYKYHYTDQNKEFRFYVLAKYNVQSKTLKC